jgi:hypothetical protein
MSGIITELNKGFTHMLMESVHLGIKSPWKETYVSGWQNPEFDPGEVAFFTIAHLALATGKLLTVSEIWRTDSIATAET